MEPNKSAYQPYHTTETALLKVKTNILQAFEKEVMCLVLLDLSAAFDTVDHQILLSRLRKRFAVRGKAQLV